MRSSVLIRAALSLVACSVIAHAPVAGAQCPEAPWLANFGGPGSVVCPCFIAGEEAGAVFTVPAGDLPIEVIRVGIAWGSQFGGAPTSLEQAIHFYEGGLPNPGTPVSSLFGPQMSDGFINEFDLIAQGSTVTIATSPLTVTLEFLNDNAGNPFAPSVAHDGAGCLPGKNVVKAIPGGWNDACMLGVTGDWVVYAVYRPINCGLGVDDERIVASGPAVLLSPRPNPFTAATRLEFHLEREAPVELAVYGLAGRRVAELVDRTYPAGRHAIEWRGDLGDGRDAPAGVYFAVLQAGGTRTVQKVVRAR